MQLNKCSLTCRDPSWITHSPPFSPCFHSRAWVIRPRWFPLLFIRTATKESCLHYLSKLPLLCHPSEDFLNFPPASHSPHTLQAPGWCVCVPLDSFLINTWIQTRKGVQKLGQKAADLQFKPLNIYSFSLCPCYVRTWAVTSMIEDVWKKGGQMCRRRLMSSAHSVRRNTKKEKKKKSNCR